eukprot:TRINITY_DN2816_c0_g1_i3.p1 TRINITY_DN2816_c0_g1~~TRINITY_DN2816_c0_g1_i3.p1  ORF type:complete len:350 (-),score=21.83 TRINITY_DN2816_c0_g1_i3:353-1402(-)
MVASLTPAEFFWCSDHDTFDKVNDVSGGLDLTASLLSVIGSSFVVMHYLLWDKRRFILSKLIFLLSLADLGASVSIALSESWLLIGSYPMAMCIGFRSSFEFFGVASWLWTGCIAYYAFHTTLFKGDLFLKETVETQTKTTTILVIIFHVISWGIPLPLCILLLAANVYKRTDAGWCHPAQPWQSATWMAPLLAVFFFNTLLTIAVAITVKYQNRLTHSRSRTHLSSPLTWQLGMFLAAYLVCWAPDVAYHILELAAPSCRLIWLALLQNFLAPLQGFLNCLVYGLSRNVRDEYKWYMLPFWILVSPILVVPVLLSAAISLCTCDRVNLLRLFDKRRSKRERPRHNKRE